MNTDKIFNGNFRAAIDLLEATKDNLEALWLGSEVCLSKGEIKGIQEAAASIEEKLNEIKYLIGDEKFGKIAH